MDTDTLIPEKLCSGTCGRTLPRTEEFFYGSFRRDRNNKWEWGSKCKTCHNASKKKKKVSSLNGHIPVTDPSDRCNACGSARNVAGHLYKGSRDIRGYLCTGCQRVVDAAQEDIDRLDKVLIYLRRTLLDKAASSML